MIATGSDRSNAVGTINLNGKFTSLIFSYQDKSNASEGEFVKENMHFIQYLNKFESMNVVG